MCVMTRLEECYWIFENVEFHQDRKMSRITYISEQRWNVGVRGSAAAGPVVGKGFGVEQRNCRGLFSSAGHQRGSWTGGRCLQPGTCWASPLVSIQRLFSFTVSSFMLFYFSFILYNQRARKFNPEEERTGRGSWVCSLPVFTNGFWDEKKAGPGRGLWGRSQIPSRRKRCGLQWRPSTITWVYFLLEGSRRVVVFTAALCCEVQAPGPLHREQIPPKEKDEMVSKCAWKTQRKAKFQLIRK